MSERLKRLTAKDYGARFRCVVCGKLTAGRRPRAVWREEPDGTLIYARKHRTANGEVCEGSYKEAEWVPLGSTRPENL